MNPEQILASMAEVYAGCATYRDTGRVITRFLKPGRKPRTTIRPFQIAFVRPDHFRFEFRECRGDAEEWDRYIVWADGAGVKTWWDLAREDTETESLDMALAGATGVSGGSAHTVPALLMPDRIAGRRLIGLTEVCALGDEVLGGVTCYKLSGREVRRAFDPAEEERLREEVLRVTGRPLQRAEHSPVAMWIDRGSLLLRRIEEQVQFETFRTEDVTDYEPAVGVAITDDELRFDPPRAGDA